MKPHKDPDFFTRAELFILKLTSLIFLIFLVARLIWLDVGPFVSEIVQALGQR